MAIAITLSAVLTGIRGWLFTLAGERVVARLRNNLFTAVMQLEVGFFDGREHTRTQTHALTYMCARTHTYIHKHTHTHSFAHLLIISHSFDLNAHIQSRELANLLIALLLTLPY